MALSTHVTVTALIYSSKTTKSLSFEPTYLYPLKKSKETFPQSEVGIKLVSLFSLNF